MFAPVIRLFKNTAFRLSMIAATLFALSSLIVLGYIYYATVTSALREVDRELQAEVSELAGLFNPANPNALTSVIIPRMIQPGTDRLYYYDDRGRPTGTLFVQPSFTENQDGHWWQKLFGTADTSSFKFTYDSNPNVGSNTSTGADENQAPMIHRARGQFKILAPGVGLFVARDVERIMEPAERVRRALLVSMGMALLLGVLSGIFVARRFSNRIAQFNKLATDVRAGDLKKRVKRDESGDELDVLAEHLNGMLDHIDRLMQAMRYAGDSIAHDLRSPLTRLRTRLENAGGEVKDEAAQLVLLEASEDAGQLLRTFDSVLRIARLEAGERREMLIELNPVALLEDMAELYEPSCEDAGLEFTMEIIGKHRIRADRGLLSQAVSNLVENAIKYTPRGGAIALRLRKVRSGRTEISITDTGMGIPAEDRQRVKERFVRLEKSRTKQGSGLGLSLVAAIADLHQAEFELSDGPGGEGGEMPGLRAALVFPRFKRN